MPANPADLLLVLIDLILELKLAVAARARIRQRHPDLLIDVIGDRPMRPRAIRLAALAPRRGRIPLRLALGERRRLTLASPPRLLELAAQPGVLSQQARVLGAHPTTAPIAPRAPQAHSATPDSFTLTHTPTPHRLQDSLHTAGILPPAPTNRPPQTSANSIPLAMLDEVIEEFSRY